MFTGIIEETGLVERVDRTSESVRLTLSARVGPRGLKVGDSLAVNGCCLTVVKVLRRRAEALVQFDLLNETCQRTNLQFVQRGSRVNWERPLRADGRLDGHFVTGHIDGLGRIQRWEKTGTDWLLEVRAGANIMRYVVVKGSIALDGISLTVAAVTKRAFQVWIIPHTFKVTSLHSRQAGDYLNVETDILGKYVERFTLVKKRGA